MVVYNRFNFAEHFEVLSKIEWRIQRFPIYPPALKYIPPPSVSTYLTRVHVLHWRSYIVTSLSPRVYSLYWDSPLVWYICRFRHIYKDMYTPLWFPRWLSVNELAWQAGDMGSISGSGRSPGEGNGNTLQYSGLGNPMDRGAWWATVLGVAKSQTQLSN